MLLVTTFKMMHFPSALRFDFVNIGSLCSGRDGSGPFIIPNRLNTQLFFFLQWLHLLYAGLGTVVFSLVSPFHLLFDKEYGLYIDRVPLPLC